MNKVRQLNEDSFWQEKAREALEKNYTPVKRYGESFIIEPPVGDVRKLSVVDEQLGRMKWDGLSERDKKRIMSVDLSDPYLLWQVANVGAKIIILKKGEKKEIELHGEGLYWVVLEKGAELKVNDLIQNDELAIRRMFVWQYEGSKFSFAGSRSGNSFMNERLQIELLEEGAIAEVRHLTYGKKKEQVDIEVAVYHRASNTESNLIARMIAADKSVNIYRGMIGVDKGLKGVTGREDAKALMVSREAVVDILPRLDVNSDDVQCDHGVGITQLNDEKLIYLRSRGLSEKEASRLIVLGFLKEDVEFSKVVEESLENMVHRGFN